MVEDNTSCSKRLRVLLLSMPFGPAHSPSMGLSLMRSVCLAEGHSCAIRYANLAFAKLIGAPLYYRLGQGYPDNVALTGEWLFSGLISERPWQNREKYFDWVLQLAAADARARKANDVHVFLDQLSCLIGQVGPFLDAEVDLAVAANPDIVGLTSVFQQNMASVAFAKRLREHLPDVPIVIGGANGEGAMGRQLLSSFPWIDAVIDGEGEKAFAQALRQISHGRRLTSWRNLRTRLPGGENTTAPLVPLAHRSRLDAPQSPLDYSEFFEQRAATVPDTDTIPIHLTFETSRGCWWGVRHHCTFCGLNGETMAFRSREPNEAIDELQSWVERYGRYPVDAVDNILDNQYFHTFVPELARRQLGLSLFYEIKSNLTRPQLELLKSAGIDRLQPGIESLSSTVLSMMRKGVTAAQNVMLLKWCKELDIELSWNYLWGFPDEPTEEFPRVAQLCRHLAHLPAPSGGGPIRLDRFSPNFKDAARIGLTNVRPFESYYFVYQDLPRASVEELSYFFTFDYASHPTPDHYVGPLSDALDEWSKGRGEYELLYIMLNDGAAVIDTRPCALEQLLFLDQLTGLVLVTCVRPMRQEALIASLMPRINDREALRAAIEFLLDHWLLIELDGLLVPIALSLEHYRPRQSSLELIAHVLRVAETALSQAEISASLA